MKDIRWKWVGESPTNLLGMYVNGSILGNVHLNKFRPGYHLLWLLVPGESEVLPWEDVPPFDIACSSESIPSCMRIVQRAYVQRAARVTEYVLAGRPYPKDMAELTQHLLDRIYPTDVPMYARLLRKESI